MAALLNNGPGMTQAERIAFMDNMFPGLMDLPKDWKRLPIDFLALPVPGRRIEILQPGGSPSSSNTTSTAGIASNPSDTAAVQPGSTSPPSLHAAAIPALPTPSIAANPPAPVAAVPAYVPPHLRQKSSNSPALRPQAPPFRPGRAPQPKRYSPSTRPSQRAAPPQRPYTKGYNTILPPAEQRIFTHLKRSSGSLLAGWSQNSDPSVGLQLELAAPAHVENTWAVALQCTRKWMVMALDAFAGDERGREDARRTRRSYHDSVMQQRMEGNEVLFEWILWKLQGCVQRIAEGEGLESAKKFAELLETGVPM